MCSKKNILLLSVIISMIIGILCSCDTAPKPRVVEGLNGPYTIEEKTIENNGKKIIGELFIPEKRLNKEIVVIVNDKGEKFTDHTERYAENFGDNNTASFVFDFSDSDESTISETNDENSQLQSKAADLEVVINYIKELDGVDKENIFLMGIGEGGLLATYVASKRTDDIKALIVISPTYDDDKGLDIYNCMPNYKKDVLIINTIKDDRVPIEYSEKAVETFRYARFATMSDTIHEHDNKYQVYNIYSKARIFIESEIMLDMEEEEFDQEPIEGLDMDTLNFYETSFQLYKYASKMIYPSQYIAVHDSYKRQGEGLSAVQLEIRMSLLSSWNVYDAKSALEIYEKLVENGTKNKSAWDLSRAMSNLYLYYVAGYINFKTAMDLSYKAGLAIQETFSSWDEYNESYLEGYGKWSGKSDRYEDYKEMTSGYRTDPFLKVPFDTKLVPYIGEENEEMKPEKMDDNMDESNVNL